MTEPKINRMIYLRGVLEFHTAIISRAVPIKRNFHDVLHFNQNFPYSKFLLHFPSTRDACCEELKDDNDVMNEYMELYKNILLLDFRF